MVWLRQDRDVDLDAMDAALYSLEHADDPLLVLRNMADLRRIGDRITELAVADARANGSTWQEVATALRRSRQSVHQQYGPPHDAEPDRVEQEP